MKDLSERGGFFLFSPLCLLYAIPMIARECYCQVGQARFAGPDRRS
jgi:hypothetical protein